MKLKVNCDGGARGNPGPAAAAFVVFDEQGNRIYQQGDFLGNATNNQAEYQAVLNAVTWLGKNYPDAFTRFFLDSQLVVNQLNGKFKIKNLQLKEIYQQIKQKILQHQLKLGDFSFVYRTENFSADSLVNQTLDKHSSE